MLAPTRRRLIGPLVGLAILGLTSGSVAAGGATHASARIINDANQTIGWARFTEDAAGRLHVNVKVEGMTPGLHGIHIHGIGVCAVGTTTAFSSAGTHHNPTGALHGLDDPAGAHAGDLPNMVVNGAGRGHLNATSDRATLSPGLLLSVFDANGSAIVIHALEDDQEATSATGNSGVRVACGVIAAD